MNFEICWGPEIGTYSNRQQMSSLPFMATILPFLPSWLCHKAKVISNRFIHVNMDQNFKDMFLTSLWHPRTKELKYVEYQLTTPLNSDENKAAL